MNLGDLKINFLGDSITQGHCATTFDEGFVSLIHQKTGAICRNYGIGGTRIARQTLVSIDPVWDQDFCSRVDGMDSDADVVVVFGGTNDYGHGAAPLGEFADQTVYTFYGALHALYRALLTKYPAAHIVVITPLHRLDEGSRKNDPRKNGVDAELKDYVRIIREVAEYYSLPVLDLYAAGGIQPQVPSICERYMVPDGLHPNNVGHEHLANKVIAYLRSALG